MFHAVSGTIVGGKVTQEGVFFKFRSAPHRHLCAHDFLDVFHEGSTPSPFLTKRMDHNVILLAVNFKVVLGPIRCNLGWRVDQNVPVWKLPLALAGTFSAAIHDLPTRGRLDRQLHRIGFMATMYMKI